MLTNANLVSNAIRSLSICNSVLVPGEILINPLPVFHSFGLTAGLLHAAVAGMKFVLYPSPLHYKQVPKLIDETKAT